MWQQVYLPIRDSLLWSAPVAAVPLGVMLISLGLLRLSSWASAFLGLLSVLMISATVYDMPLTPLLSATAYGAASGLFPIAWVVFWAVALYRLTAETGQFEIIKSSVGHVTTDKRMQAMLVAFAFGGFIEGATGFGTPVAVAAAMLTGLGFSPFYAAGICLLANTAPVAFGAIGTPLVTLASVTGLPLGGLSADVGLICAPIALFTPAYLMVVMGGARALAAVWPGALMCGLAFAVTQYAVSRYVGPGPTAILAAVAAILGSALLLRVWHPADAQVTARPPALGARVILRAWSPYILLVILVLLWGEPHVKALLDQYGTVKFPWPYLDGEITRMPPVVPQPGPYPAIFTLNMLSAAGTATMLATLLAAPLLGVSAGRLLGIIGRTTQELATTILTIAAVLALAYVMNYAGLTATLALAFSATGVAFPFFGAALGWVGVFLTGSDTSSNALFGNLQVVTAGTLGLPPSLMAAANASGGVMGKMISLQSISVAAAATRMPADDEANLFRFTLKHSILLACVVGLVVTAYAYLPAHLAQLR